MVQDIILPSLHSPSSPSFVEWYCAGPFLTPALNLHLIFTEPHTVNHVLYTTVASSTTIMLREFAHFTFSALLFLCLTYVAISADVRDRSPHKLWRRVQSQARSGVTFVADAGVYQSRDLKVEQQRDLLSFDPAECKKYCQRNYDDTIGYKCSVSSLPSRDVVVWHCQPQLCLSALSI